MKRQSLFLFCILCTVLLLCGCAAFEDAIVHQAKVNRLLECDYHGQVICDLRYAEGDFHSYDLYLPEDLSSPNAKHLILYIHGGGWLVGDKIEGEIWCRYFASKGYTAASVRYTLLDFAHNTNVNLVNEEIHMAAQAVVQECQNRGLTLVDMATSGFSAGGCQALLYAFKDPSSSVLPVKFVINQSGPTTFDPQVWMKGNVEPIVTSAIKVDGSTFGNAFWISLVSGVGVSQQMVLDGSADAIWQAISPACLVNASSVPVLMAYGGRDRLVPSKSRVVLENALDAAGVPYFSILMEHSGHGLIFDSDKYKILVEKADEFCQLYF